MDNFIGNLLKKLILYSPSYESIHFSSLFIIVAPQNKYFKTTNGYLNLFLHFYVWDIDFHKYVGNSFISALFVKVLNRVLRVEDNFLYTVFTVIFFCKFKALIKASQPFPK